MKPKNKLVKIAKKGMIDGNCAPVLCIGVELSSNVILC